MSIPFKRIDISNKKPLAKFGYWAITVFLLSMLVIAITSFKITITITAITLTSLLIAWLLIAAITLKEEGKDNIEAKWLSIEVTILFIITIFGNMMIWKGFQPFGWAALVIVLIFKIVPNIIFKRK